MAEAPSWAKLLAAITLHGWLSILLVFYRLDRNRPVRVAKTPPAALRESLGKPPAWLIPSSSEIGRRGAALAALQLAGGKLQSAALNRGQR